jgi:hypothetical protein
LLKDARRGPGAIQSEIGSSREQRRVEALTLENCLSWGADWKTFLRDRKFSVMKRYGVKKGGSSSAPPEAATPAPDAPRRSKRGREPPEEPIEDEGEEMP